LESLAGFVSFCLVQRATHDEGVACRHEFGQCGFEQ
jgi:hypothetical protein